MIPNASCDFDRAEIYDENELDDWETKLLEEERAIVADFHRFLVRQLNLTLLVELGLIFLF